MTAPRHLFLDTSVFDSIGYNFLAPVVVAEVIIWIGVAYVRRKLDDRFEGYICLRKRAGTVRDQASVVGTAKLNFEPNWTVVTEVTDVLFETSSVDVHGEPDGHDDDDR
jgi:hypothetical protein